VAKVVSRVFVEVPTTVVTDEMVVYLVVVDICVMVVVGETVAEAAAGAAVAAPAFKKGATTHWEARELSTYFPFCFVGVKLKT
jgi:hypothetical protein